MMQSSDDERPPEAGEEGINPGSRSRSISIVSDRIDSRDLFVKTRQIIIGHGDELYRLHLTSQNKLILTK